MNCKCCDKEMEVIDVNDNPNRGYAYNIFHCIYCMVVCKEDVWENKGELWIYPCGTIFLEKENTEYTIYKEK